MFLSKTKSEYSTLTDVEPPEYEGDLKIGTCSHSKRNGCASFSRVLLILLVCVPVTFVTTLFGVRCGLRVADPHGQAGFSCVRPPIRREWRTLDKAERHSYIKAVQCLTTKTSVLGVNGTAYDDIPWLHQHIHPTAHQSAPFLPWHRIMIHIYERTLKERCGYEGVLPYWDWSQDWQTFEASPVFDTEYGFGGDGGAPSERSIGNGRCVADGPFADVQAMYYGTEFKPHCLSRGFAKGDALRNLTELINPDALENLMKESDYAKFASELEHRAHTFIGKSIGGDFVSFTGPYDPIFFLHHGNLDRLWAKWQQRHDAKAYSGKANMLTEDRSSARITDMMVFGDLWESVPVANVMDTTSGYFCYQY